MSRFLLLMIANIALPFLLWGLKIYITRWLEKRREQKGVIDVTPSPASNWPIGKLLLAGIILLACTLLAIRFVDTDAPDTPWSTPNTVRTTN